MRKRYRRTISIVLAEVMLVSLLCGCGAQEPSTDAIQNTDSVVVLSTPYQEITTTEEIVAPTETPVPSSEPLPSSDEVSESSDEMMPETPVVSVLPEVTIIQEDTAEQGLSEQQMNSFSMLYYLAITAEEIRIAKDNRLLLDDIYTALLNDINPGTIDETTQDHLQNLRDIIKQYINISEKRDRLQYLYNQDKAASIRSAVPNPLAILSMTNAVNWRQLATSVVFTIVDSYSNYKEVTDSADQEFLMSGWELDDEEKETIYKNRERAFDYMVDIVQEYDLDGNLTLNEQAIETFAEICAIEETPQKIRRLESEEKTYSLLGNYWLELADCYFEASQYEKCLDCVNKYNELPTGIFRRDFNYVSILPKAIVAAQTIYEGDEYISNIEAFVDSIIANTATDEWSIRYFAAQVYLDLYARTDNRTYLETAYNIAYDNVTILLDEQRALNADYLEEVQEVEIEEPDYRFMTEDEKDAAEQEYKEERKRLKAYNKALNETRETELPPLYEPLVLNCDLLFALADEMNISDFEESAIEAILQTDRNGVFLATPINNRYSFSATDESYAIEFDAKELVVPVSLLTSEASIIVSVEDNGKTEVFNDCIVTEVERAGASVDSFSASVVSELMKDYAWSADSKVTVTIINRDETDPIIFEYEVSEYKDNWLIPDKVVFSEA